MKILRRASSPIFGALFLLLGCVLLFASPTRAQNTTLSGRSITWRPVRSPFTPDANNGAIVGGPGSDPNLGTPMYICRAQIQGAVVPGKWFKEIAIFRSVDPSESCATTK